VLFGARKAKKPVKVDFNFDKLPIKW